MVLVHHHLARRHQCSWQAAGCWSRWFSLDDTRCSIRIQLASQLQLFLISLCLCICGFCVPLITSFCVEQTATRLPNFISVTDFWGMWVTRLHKETKVKVGLPMVSHIRWYAVGWEGGEGVFFYTSYIRLSFLSVLTQMWIIVRVDKTKADCTVSLLSATYNILSDSFKVNPMCRRNCWV